jgi:hypothetical protein
MTDIRASAICNGVVVGLAFALLAGCGEEGGRRASPARPAIPVP